MKKKYSILFLNFLIITFAFSQKQTEKWYFSGKGALDFSSGTPVSLSNNAMALSWEGCASLADASGNLLFYTDGTNSVYANNHTVMPNGSGLFMFNSITQGCVFVPQPGSSTIYYLIYIGLPAVGPGPFNLYYSEIDMSLNGGLGDINPSKNVQIASATASCSEKMAVTRHCNGTDYWLVLHDYSGNTFNSYLITSTGISATPVTSTIGSVFQAGTTEHDAMGQMKISPAGNKIALALHQSQQVELFNFNKSTGVVSNVVNLGAAGQQVYGIEFSPDNTKLYSSNGGSPAMLLQWNICAGDSAAINASKDTISATNIYSLQLAPNGKIYGAQFGSANLAVINNPNLSGVASNFSAAGPSISPNTCLLGLPNFSSSYFDIPATTPFTSLSFTDITCNCTDSATVSITGGCGTGPYTYQWSTGPIVGPTTATSSTINNLCPGSYNVIVTDAACKRDTLTFTLNGGAIVPVTQGITICSNTSYVLPGGDTVNTAGTYNDTLTSVGGCDSIIKTILLVNTAPIASISADITIQPGVPTSLTASGTAGVTSYQWFPTTALTCDTCATTTVSPSQTIQYCAVVADTNGCRDTACVNVNVLCPDFKDIEMPNVFTPNNDGMNDVFYLFGWDLCIDSYKMMVFDRWGIKIFEADNVNVVWDGHISSGTEAPSGTYYYTIELSNKNGNSEKLAGFVTLLRH